MATKATRKNGERFAPSEVVSAIETAGGCVSQVARSLGCHRQTVYEYAERHKEVAQALADAREEMIDEAESSLRRAARSGEGWAVCFALKCLAKHRGYVERGSIELTGKDGGPIETRSTIDVSKLSTETLRRIAEEAGG